MTTPRFPPLTSWDGDPAVLLADARAMLGLAANDPDVAQLSACVDAVVEQVRAFLDDPVPFDSVEAPLAVPASVYEGCLLATVEGYRRKDATFGLAGSFTADGIPVRISNDWLAPVRALLVPYKRQWGVA